MFGLGRKSVAEPEMGVDEAPFAYKDIETVMQSQKALVDTVGKFTPKIVKMDGTAPKIWRKKSEVVEGE